MVNIVENAQRSAKIDVPAEFLKGKRHLTAQEIKVLEANLNHNEDSSWNNFYVSEEEGAFDPSLIHLSP